MALVYLGAHEIAMSRSMKHKQEVANSKVRRTLICRRVELAYNRERGVYLHLRESSRSRSSVSLRTLLLLSIVVTDCRTFKEWTTDTIGHFLHVVL